MLLTAMLAVVELFEVFLRSYFEFCMILCYSYFLFQFITSRKPVGSRFRSKTVPNYITSMKKVLDARQPCNFFE